MKKFAKLFTSKSILKIYLKIHPRPTDNLPQYILTYPLPTLELPKYTPNIKFSIIIIHPIGGCLVKLIVTKDNK